MIKIKRIFTSLRCNASIPVAKPAAAFRREEEEQARSELSVNNGRRFTERSLYRV